MRNSLIVKVRLAKSRRVYTMTTVKMNFSKFQTLLSLVTFVWNLRCSTNLTFTTEEVDREMFKKILSVIFLSKLTTHVSSDLCTQPTESKLVTFTDQKTIPKPIAVLFLLLRLKKY